MSGWRQPRTALQKFPRQSTRVPVRISTVDPDARHGHKTSARGFDGYKGHVAVDPDSELITATKVTAGNVGDGAPAPDLLADDFSLRVSAAADGTDAVGGLLTFAESLSARTR